MNDIRPIERHEIQVSVIYFDRSGACVDETSVAREFRCRVGRRYCVDCDPEYRGQGPRTTPCPEQGRHDHEPKLEPVMADVLAWVRDLWRSGGQGGMPGGRGELFDGFVYVECPSGGLPPHLAVGPGVWPLIDEASKHGEAVKDQGWYERWVQLPRPACGHHSCPRPLRTGRGETK